MRRFSGFAKKARNASAMISPTPSICSNSSRHRCSTAAQLFLQNCAIRRALAVPMPGMPRLYRKRCTVVCLARSAEASRFSKDFLPKPSISVILPRSGSRRNRSAGSRISPSSTNFCSVISESPSMFIALRLTKCTRPRTCFARQSGFGQCSVCTPFSSWIAVGCPQTGQTAGIGMLSLPVRFSAICGMIMFAL